MAEEWQKPEVFATLDLTMFSDEQLNEIENYHLKILRGNMRYAEHHGSPDYNMRQDGLERIRDERSKRRAQVKTNEDSVAHRRSARAAWLAAIGAIVAALVALANLIKSLFG